MDKDEVNFNSSYNDDQLFCLIGLKACQDILQP